MKIVLAQVIRPSRYLLAAASGLLLTAAFPKIGCAGLAWVAPGVLAVAVLGQRGGEAFRIGYLAGLVHYLTSLDWLLRIPVAWFPLLGWAALSAYLALYPAAWAWLISRLAPPTPADDSGHGADLWSGSFATWPWAKRAGWALAGATMWVALELIRARLFTGFAWNLIGVSQSQLIPLIQLAALTGVYGVSFLVVWSALALVLAGHLILARPTLRSAWLTEILLPLTAVGVAFGFGLTQLRQRPPATRELTLALVQPSIPQTMIWDPSEASNRFRQVIEISRQALATKPDLLLWPEAAVPNFLRYDPETYTAVTELARTHRVWMIIGADDAEPRGGASPPEAVDYFNSSFLISPQGALVSQYRKRRLVAFGEYVPLARWLPMLKYFTPISGSFTPGDQPVRFVMPDLGFVTSVLICFEDTFPHLARQHAGPDVDFLVNLTNDGWFRESAAQWQHAANAAFRAVENGLPLVRCANNGLTCWVDSAGRIRDVFLDAQGRVYGPGYTTMTLLLPSDAARLPATFYRRHGDVFGWGCLAVSLGIVAAKIRYKACRPTF